MAKKIISSLFVIMLLFVGCKAENALSRKSQDKRTYQSILKGIEHPSKKILVASHRGDWRNAPENSIRAIENCIKIGVDIVEIDLAMAKDSVLILMHDATLDRTTTGTGRVAEKTFAYIETLFLKNGAGAITRYKVPTLIEAMNTIKGKPILVNLDKAWDYIDVAIPILKKTGTLDQCIFKGSSAMHEMISRYGELMSAIHYMPIVNNQSYVMPTGTTLSPKDYTELFTKVIRPLAFEIVFDKETSPQLSLVPVLQEKGIAVWVNSLWASLCAGHDDDLAIDDPEAHWGWLINLGANIIQTDMPKKMLEYLEKKGLR